MSEKERKPWQKLAEQCSCHYRQRKDLARHSMLQYATEAQQHMLNEVAAYLRSTRPALAREDNYVPSPASQPRSKTHWYG